MSLNSFNAQYLNIRQTDYYIDYASFDVWRVMKDLSHLGTFVVGQPVYLESGVLCGNYSPTEPSCAPANS